MKVVGWCLLNSSISNSHFENINKSIESFKSSGLIAMDNRVVFGQKFILNSFRGLGLIHITSDLLEINNASKYDTYLATVKKNNQKSINFLNNNSYKNIYEDKERMYYTKQFVYSNKVINSLQIQYKDGFEFLVRMADNIDLIEINRIMSLNNYRTLTDLSNGFLTNTYTIAELETIASKNELIVIEEKNGSR